MCKLARSLVPRTWGTWFNCTTVFLEVGAENHHLGPRIYFEFVCKKRPKNGDVLPGRSNLHPGVLQPLALHPKATSLEGTGRDATKGTAKVEMADQRGGGYEWYGWMVRESGIGRENISVMDWAKHFLKLFWVVATQIFFKFPLYLGNDTVWWFGNPGLFTSWGKGSWNLPLFTIGLIHPNGGCLEFLNYQQFERLVVGWGLGCWLGDVFCQILWCGWNPPFW